MPVLHVASAVLTAALALALRPVAGIQPKSDGHFLTNTELRNITAIACLEARQRNPGIQCVNGSVMTRTLGGVAFNGQLNAGNYPHYEDAACNSNGEFFCDPAGIFSLEERQNLTQELGRLRNSYPVTCGFLLNDPVDPRHYQPFYLGVALAAKWPSGESDPDSLQQFGQIVAAQWNMDQLFVGSPIPYLKCPNTAMLIVLPDIHRAFISSPSCELICQDRGGPEVTTAALLELDRNGPAAAVRAAMQEVYAVVSHGGRAKEHTEAAKEEEGNAVAFRVVKSKAAPDAESANANASVLVQRILFGFAVVALVGSGAFALVVLLAAPGWLTPRRRWK